ncbi:MAG: hypothetical protein GY940_27795 [bacterium]|nr:hypothetical protein [bacterium]
MTGFSFYYSLLERGQSKKLQSGDDLIDAPIRTFTNIPGLFIHGCSFKNLHPDSDLSEESKKLMRQYGAEMDEEG